MGFRILWCTLSHGIGKILHIDALNPSWRMENVDGEPLYLFATLSKVIEKFRPIW